MFFVSKDLNRVAVIDQPQPLLNARSAARLANSLLRPLLWMKPKAGQAELVCELHGQLLQLRHPHPIHVKKLM